jgi:sugar lactone lactonase YvrE
MPVPHPVDLAVGGHDGQTLFITSARHRVPMETLASAPLSGRLFSLSLAPPA